MNESPAIGFSDYYTAQRSITDQCGMTAPNETTAVECCEELKEKGRKHWGTKAYASLLWNGAKRFAEKSLSAPKLLRNALSTVTQIKGLISYRGDKPRQEVSSSEPVIIPRMDGRD